MNVSASSVSQFASGKRSWVALAGQVSYEISYRVRGTCARCRQQRLDFVVDPMPPCCYWSDWFTFLISHPSIQQWSRVLCVFLYLLATMVLNTERVFAQQTPKQTAAGFKVADGLQVSLWAAEPDLVNPTNIDVDSKGRVWVLEAVNYGLTLSGRVRRTFDRLVTVLSF